MGSYCYLGKANVVQTRTGTASRSGYSAERSGALGRGDQVGTDRRFVVLLQQSRDPIPLPAVARGDDDPLMLKSFFFIGTCHEMVNDRSAS